MRGLGISAALGDFVGPVVVLSAIVTQLGDLWFLAVLAFLPYWLGGQTPFVGEAVDRGRAAMVVALLFGATALIVTLKPFFGLPRPSDAGVAPYATVIPSALDSLYFWLSTGDGYGFPSGHALGSTVVYGGLAWAVQRGDRLRRVAFASAMVVVVSLSRLVLGVHFLVDVVVGAALGLAFLALVLGGLSSVRRAFLLASAVVLAGLVVVGPVPDVVGTAGLCAGGTVVWLAAGDRLLDRHATYRGGILTGTIGVVTAGPLLVVVSAGYVTSLFSLTVGIVGGALVVALPLIGEGIAERLA